MRSAIHSCFLTLNLERKVMHKLLDVSRNAKVQVTAVSYGQSRVLGHFCRKTSSFDNCTKCYWPIVKMWKYKLKRLHTISRKLDKQRWLKNNENCKQSIFQQKFGNKKLKSGLSATGAKNIQPVAFCTSYWPPCHMATWPMPQPSQLKDTMQKYSTHQIWPA